MGDTIYTEISKLLDAGATLEEVQTLIDVRSSCATEEERSATWLRDWHEWQRGRHLDEARLEPLE
jgi:hypothetical protein